RVVEIGARRALHGPGRRITDPVPDAVAACARGAIVAVRARDRRASRRTQRLRIGGGFQPRVQTRIRHASGNLASGPHVTAHGASSSSSPLTGSYLSPLA